MPLSTITGTSVLPGAVVPGGNSNIVLLDSVADDLTAHAGGGQTDAWPITTKWARFTTVASAGNSARLPAAKPGMAITVRNDAATNAMNVFPASGEFINAGAADAAFSVTAAHETVFRCYVAGKWRCVLSN